MHLSGFSLIELENMLFGSDFLVILSVKTLADVFTSNLQFSFWITVIEFEFLH